MKSSGWGRIINMSAGSAFIRNHGVYTLAKTAVKTITESLALELGPEITVNAIAPGQIEESLPDIHKFDPTFEERYLKRVPVKKLVTRKEVANMIALLCTSSFNSDFCLPVCILLPQTGPVREIQTEFPARSQSLMSVPF